MGEAALPRSNSVSRVLWDRETGVYFGYRVEVERREAPRPFRVSFRPLDRAAVERELRQRGDCPGCPPPAPLGAGPRFPAPQLLAEGETLTLELLANPETGERILDVVRVSARPVPPTAMRAAAARVLEGQQAVRRAAAHVARARYAAAAAEYRRALEVQPFDPTVHNKLGICYQQLGNDAMARREYERALELDPGYAEVWNNVGTLEQSRRRFKPAVRAYKKAIETKPGLATPWKNLGNAYLAMGQVQEAFEAYQEAFRLDPTILESQGVGDPAAGIDAADAELLPRQAPRRPRADGRRPRLPAPREGGGLPRLRPRAVRPPTSAPSWKRPPLRDQKSLPEVGVASPIAGWPRSGRRPDRAPWPPASRYPLPLARLPYPRATTDAR
jgi:tetratricopeptide (TPR) repeat protein